nr:hypothetical protein [Tanacetum cinerariifolium]
MVFHLVDGVRASGVEMIYKMNFVHCVIQEIHALMILIRILSIALSILTTLHTPHTRLTHDAFGNKQYKPEDIQKLFRKLFNDNQNIHEELAEYINTLSWNRPAFYNNGEDDDKDYTMAITPDFLITNSLSMGDEHLSTIPKKELDEFIKSSVKNLVTNPSKFEDLADIESECDVLVCDDFTTFYNSLFDADDNFSSSDDESFSDEDVLKEIYVNPLLYEEIIFIKIDPHHFNTESDLIESLLNQDSSINCSPKIDSLLEEFFDELAHIDLIPRRINEADFNPEEENRDCIFLAPDDSIPSGIENDEFDSEGDILFLKELLSNDSPSLPDNKSFHFDVPSSPCPPAKPLDDGIYFDDEPVTRILTTKVVGDIYEHYVLMPRLLPTQPTFASNEEKSPHLLSHQGFKAFQLISKSLMMIYGWDSPTLDVPFIHFYPF